MNLITLQLANWGQSTWGGWLSSINIRQHLRTIDWRWFLKSNWPNILSIPTSIFLSHNEKRNRCFHTEGTDNNVRNNLEIIAQWLIHCSTELSVKEAGKTNMVNFGSFESRFHFCSFLLFWTDLINLSKQPVHDVT